MLIFTDNEDFEYGQPEKLIVSSSAQTIELKLKSVRGDNMPFPTVLYARADEWDESTQSYKEISEFNPSSGFYEVYSKKDNGEPTIYRVDPK